MKVDIELPKWTNENHIWVIAGQTPVALRIRLKKKDGTITYKWYRKTARCDLCGKCCMNLNREHLFVKEDGTCQFLEDVGAGQFECHMPFGMPWGCLTGQGKPKPWSLDFAIRPARVPGCTVEYEEM